MGPWCPNGYPVEADAFFCPRCGVSLLKPATATTCPNGHPIAAGAVFCDRCGMSLLHPIGQAVPMSRPGQMTETVPSIPANPNTEVKVGAGHTGEPTTHRPLYQKWSFWLAGAAVLILVAAIALVATNSSSAPSTNGSVPAFATATTRAATATAPPKPSPAPKPAPPPTNSGNSGNSGTPATVTQVETALESTGITLCPIVGNTPSQQWFGQIASGSDCAAKTGLIILFSANSSSDVETQLTDKDGLNGGEVSEWIDGTVGVLDAVPAPGTGSTLERLGFTSYHPPANTESSGSTGNTP